METTAIIATIFGLCLIITGLTVLVFKLKKHGHDARVNHKLRAQIDKRRPGQ